MFELRILRKSTRKHFLDDITHDDVLQFRTKDRHVESSTTTPKPLAWSKWKDVPIVLSA